MIKALPLPDLCLSEQVLDVLVVDGVGLLVDPAQFVQDALLLQHHGLLPLVRQRLRLLVLVRDGALGDEVDLAVDQGLSGSVVEDRVLTGAISGLVDLADLGFIHADLPLGLAQHQDVHHLDHVVHDRWLKKV